MRHDAYMSHHTLHTLMNESYHTYQPAQSHAHQ